MWALAAIAALVLVVGVLALVMPLRLALRFGGSPWRYDLRVSPFGGLLGWISLPRPAPTAMAPERSRKPGTPGTRPPGPVLRALPGLLAAIIDRTRIDRLRLDLRFGTGDPALTGQVYGWLMPLVYGVGGASVADLRVRPEFDRVCLAGDAEVLLHLRPVRLAGPLFRFWQAVRAGS